MICHITTQAAWELGKSSGTFRSPEFDDFGFIHCSTPEQVLLVANAFFAGRSGLVLLIVDESKLKSPIRWEPPHWTGPLPGFTINTVFPHVYGPINADSVVRTIPLEPNERGAFLIPIPA